MYGMLSNCCKEIAYRSVSEPGNRIEQALHAGVDCRECHQSGPDPAVVVARRYLGQRLADSGARPVAAADAVAGRASNPLAALGARGLLTLAFAVLLGDALVR